MMLSWPISSICWAWAEAWTCIWAWAWAFSIMDLGLFHHPLPLEKGFVLKSNAFSSSSLCGCMWLDGFHHPLLLERICPQIYRFDLEQQPYSYFEKLGSSSRIKCPSLWVIKKIKCVSLSSCVNINFRKLSFLLFFYCFWQLLIIFLYRCCICSWILSCIFFTKSSFVTPSLCTKVCGLGRGNKSKGERGLSPYTTSNGKYW